MKIKVKHGTFNLLLYILFRVASFAAAAIPPAARALMLFPVWKEPTVVQVKASLGFGAILALIIMAIAFKSTLVGSLKKHTGLTRVLVVVVIWGCLMGLRIAAPHIYKLEEVAFYAVIGGLGSWVLSAIAAFFKFKSTGILS